MESTRQHKVSRLIQKDLSDILLRYARSLSGTLISVSEVRVSPDLAIAHVYLSIFPQDRMDVRYAPQTANSRKFMIVSRNLMFFIRIKNMNYELLKFTGKVELDIFVVILCHL